MRNWLIFIFRQLFVFLGVTIAGSFLPGFFLVLPVALFRGEISLDGVRAFAGLVAFQHILIAPSVIFYVPIVIGLWKKGKRDTRDWAMIGALCMLFSAAFMIMAINHFDWPPSFFGWQGASIVGIYMFVGFVLGTIHIFALTLVNKRWPKYLSVAES